MEYRITKEYGEGRDAPRPEIAAWGVAEGQHARARKVAEGDILPHFIDFAHAWAGYSVVSGPVQENHRDSDKDWLDALPYVIPIERGVWLDEGQCAQFMRFA